MQFPSVLVLLLATIVAPLVSAVDKAVDPELNAKLLVQPSQLGRLDLLKSDSDWLFDFHAQKSYSFDPGSVVVANAVSWPAATENELTMSLISLGPCSMLPPHYHPRGSNYVLAMSGNTTTYMIEENGARMVTAHLTPGKMTIMPRSSIHAMANQNCDQKAELVAALSSTDTGTHNIVNGLFQLPDYVVNAAFGNPDGGLKYDKSNIPPVGYGSIKGDPECMKRCGK